MLTQQLKEIHMNFEPLRDVVLIRREAAEEKVGSIILAGNKEEPPRGTVLKVGPGRVTEDGTKVEMTVKEGDRVIFAPTSGHPVKFGTDDDEKLIVMTEAEIIGIIRD